MTIDRIEQFILLLGSDQPGEVVNAAGMLVKALRKEGRDLHSLVHQLNGKHPPDNQIEVFRLMGELFNATARIETLSADLRASRAHCQKLELVILSLQKQVQDKPRAPPQKPFGTPRTAGEGWHDKAAWALAYGWELSLINSKEFDFLQSLASKLPSYQPSFKQESWLDDIVQRLRRVEASRR